MLSLNWLCVLYFLKKEGQMYTKDQVTVFAIQPTPSFFQFTHEKSEAQGEQVAYLRFHSKSVAVQLLRPCIS